jgi:hemolysin III
MTPSPAPARMKPLYRGVSHEIAAFLSLPAAVALVALAKGSTAVAAAAVYGASLVLLFSASAVFHRPQWQPRKRDILGRVDQAAIFVLIGGTYTPFCLLLGRGAGRLMLGIAWMGVLLGVALALLWPTAPKRVMAIIYVLLGWFVVPVLPSLYSALPGGHFTLLVGGGLLYTTGAVIYALRRPDPYPAVFGYHEIFHLLVIVGAACHFGVATVVIQALG